MADSSLHIDFYSDAFSVRHNFGHDQKGNREQKMDDSIFFAPNTLRALYLLYHYFDSPNFSPGLVAAGARLFSKQKSLI